MARSNLHVSRSRVPSCCARASKKPAERRVSSCLIGTTFSRIRIPFASPSRIALSRGPYLKCDQMVQNVTDIEEIRPSHPYPATPSSYAGLPSWGLPTHRSRQASPLRPRSQRNTPRSLPQPATALQRVRHHLAHHSPEGLRVVHDLQVSKLVDRNVID